MTKRDLINDICRLNRSAQPEFLVQFSENELWMYLKRLIDLKDRHQVSGLPISVSASEIAG